MLLDEFDRAHRDVLQLFMQVFDEGKLTDNKGKTVDFQECIFVLTTNAPVDLDARGTAVRLRSSSVVPELFNRIDETIRFAALTTTDAAAIARLILQEFARWLKPAGGGEAPRFDPTEAALALAAEEGFDSERGARSLRSYIENVLIGTLLREHPDFLVERPGLIRVDASEGGYVFAFE